MGSLGSGMEVPLPRILTGVKPLMNSGVNLAIVKSLNRLLLFKANRAFYASTLQSLSVKDTVAFWMMIRGILWQSVPERLFSCNIPPHGSFLTFLYPYYYHDKPAGVKEEI